MGKEKIVKFVKNLEGEIQKNSPTILVCLAVGGVISTTVFAIRATPKAIRVLDEERDSRFPLDSDKKEEPLSKVDILKLTWKFYIPTACMGAATIACIIGANSINKRRNAALATMYSLTETAFHQYKDKVVETVGKNKELAIRDKIDEDKVKTNPPGKNEVIFTGKGEVLCRDSYSGRYFRSDIEKIRQAVNEINKDFLSEMWVSLNDLYYAFGLSGTELGDQLGWDLDQGLVEVSFSSQLTENNEPCLVINYEVRPKFAD